MPALSWFKQFYLILPCCLWKLNMPCLTTTGPNQNKIKFKKSVKIQKFYNTVLRLFLWTNFCEGPIDWIPLLPSKSWLPWFVQHLQRELDMPWVWVVLVVWSLEEPMGHIPQVNILFNGLFERILLMKQNSNFVILLLLFFFVSKSYKLPDQNIPFQ